MLSIAYIAEKSTPLYSSELLLSLLYVVPLTSLSPIDPGTILSSLDLSQAKLFRQDSVRVRPIAISYSNVGPVGETAQNRTALSKLASGFMRYGRMMAAIGAGPKSLLERIADKITNTKQSDSVRDLRTKKRRRTFFENTPHTAIELQFISGTQSDTRNARENHPSTLFRFSFL